MNPLRRWGDFSAVRIASGYLLFGGLWILLSDNLVNQLVQRQDLVSRIQTVKGWLFVLVSAMLILGLVRTREHQLKNSRNRLSRATEELHVLHRIYRHNIRNDLTVVRGYIDMIRDELDEIELKQQLEKAHDSTDRILGVSEKLRMIEAADTTASNDGTVDVMAVIRQEAGHLSTEYPAVTVDIDGPAKAWVYGDETLAYVVREVFANAVEHHDGPLEHCRIDVTVERSVSEVTVEIVDNGPGISDYELQALEAGDESQLVHTSGIGLWLVKWLCLFYDGSVDVKRRPEGGTAVTLAFEPSLKLEQVIDQAWNEIPLEAEA